MNWKVTLLCMFATGLVLGQEANTDKPGKFAVGLVFSPDYCYRALTSATSSVDWRNDIEIPKFGYTTGLSGGYRFNSKFGLEVNIQYSNKGEQTTEFELTYIDPDPIAPQKVRYVYNYLYMDLPVKAMVYLLDKKLQFFLSAGFSTNFFIGEKVVVFYTYEDGRTEKKSSLSNSSFYRVNLAVSGSMGLGYNFGERINLRVEPIFRSSVTPIVNAPIKGYLYSLGLNVGVYYKLK